MERKTIIDSLHGLITITDATFRLVSYFASNFEPTGKDPDAHDRLDGIADELQEMAGLLHSLSLSISAFGRDEDDHIKFPVSLPPQLIACHQTLARLERSLRKREVDAELKKRENGHCAPFLNLRWPFTRAWTIDLLRELVQHKDSISKAVSRTRRRGSMESIWASFSDKKNPHETYLESTRQTMYVGLKTPWHDENLCFFTKVDHYPRFEQHLKARNPLSRFPLLESKMFKSWMTTRGLKGWLTAPPGTGKTVLAAAMIEAIARPYQPKTAIAFHFCDFSDPRTHDIANIIGSLAFQVACSDHEAKRMLDKYRDELQSSPKGTAGKPTVERMKDLLLKMSIIFRRVMIVVDGVNECGVNTKAVTEFLSSLVSMGDVNLSLIIVSRDEPEIRDIIQDGFQNVDVDTAGDQSELFAATKLQRKVTDGRLRFDDPQLTDEAIRRIGQNPGTTPLQASLHVDFLCGLETSAQQNEFLDNLPNTLYDTYKLFLRHLSKASADSKALIQAILQLASISNGALGIVELCQALSVAGIPGLDADLLAHPEVDESEIMSQCGMFLRKSDDGNQISLAHFTLKEFLEGIEASDPEFADFRLSESRTSRTLSLCALRFLCLDHFARLPTRSNSEEAFIVNRDARYPFYRYAALSWPYLAADNWDDPEFREQVMELCHPTQTSNFKSWCLEVCRFYHFHGSYSARPDSRYSFWIDCMDSDSSVGSESTQMSTASSWSRASSNSRSSGIAGRRPISVEMVNSFSHPWRNRWREREPRQGWYKGQTRNLSKFTRRGDFTPLHMAALLGIDNLCRALLDDGANVNQPSLIGTPLQCALGGPSLVARYGFSAARNARLGPPFMSQPSKETIKLLIESGAECSRILPYHYRWSSMGALALKSSEWANDYQIFALLVKGGAEMHDDAVEIFRKQCRKWATDKSQSAKSNVTAALEMLAELVANGEWEASAYKTAFQKVVTETADLDTKLPISIGVTDEMLVERMLQAIENDSLTALKENTHNQQGVALLHGDTLKRLLDFCISCSSISCLDFILTSYVDPEEEDARKGELLLNCTNDRMEDVLVCLLKHGAKTTQKDGFGDTIWHRVADDVDALRVLDALFNHVGQTERETALCITNKNGRTALAEALISESDQNARMIIGRCQRHRAVLQSTKPLLGNMIAGIKSANTLKQLHEAGLLPESTSETPLNCLDVSAKVEGVRQLLEIYSYKSLKAPLESYLEATRFCMFDDEVVTELITADMAEPSDKARPSLWKYVCNKLQDMYKSPTHESTQKIAGLFNIMINLRCLQAYEETSGTSALKAIEPLFSTANMHLAAEVNPYIVSLFEDIFALTFDSTAHPLYLKSNNMDVKVLKWAIRCDSIFLVDRLLRLETNVHTRENGMNALEFTCIQHIRLNTHRIFARLLEKADKSSLNQLMPTPSGESFGLLHLLTPLNFFVDAPSQIPTIGFMVSDSSHLSSQTHETPGIPLTPPPPPAGYARLEQTGGLSRFKEPAPNIQLRLLQQLLEKGVDPNVPSQPRNRLPMSTHLQIRRLDSVQVLLRCGGYKTLHVPDENGWTPVSWACLHGWTELLEEMACSPSPEPIWDFRVKLGLLKLGTHLMKFEGLSALHLATLASAETVAFLLDRGIATDLDVRASDGSTPLYLASLFGQTDSIRLLVSRGADINAQTKFHKWTALHVAVSLQIEPSTKVLLDLGAKHLPTRDGKTTLDLALRRKNLKITQAIQKSIQESLGGVSRRNATSGTSGLSAAVLSRAMEHAIAGDDHETCERLLRDGCPPDIRMASCHTCSGLIFTIGRRYMASCHRQNIVQSFIDRGASFLGVACRRHSFASFKYGHLYWEDDISDAESSSSSSGSSSNSSSASITSSDETVPSAKKTGTQVPQPKWPRYGLTVLDLMVYDPDITKYMAGWLRSIPQDDLLWLIDHSAPAYTAIAVGCPKSLDVLFSYLAELGTVSGRHLARYLANQMTRDSYEGITVPLHTATRKKNLAMAELVVKHGANVNALVEGSGTALHIAAANNCASLAAFLLDNGASMVTRDEDGFTPLHLAAFHDCLAVMELLVERGARIRGNVDATEIMVFDSARALVLLLKAGMSLNRIGMLSIPAWVDVLVVRDGASFILNSDLGHGLEFGTARGTPWRLWWESKTFGRLRHICRSLRLFYRRFGLEFIQHIAEFEPGEGESHGFGLLCLLAGQGRISDVKELLKMGLDPEFEGSATGTVLMAAASAGRLEVVKLLVFHGARIHYKKNGRWISAVDAAVDFPDIVNWLVAGRFVEQGKIEGLSEASAEDLDTRTCLWSGVWRGEFLLVGKYQRPWDHSTLEWLSSLSKARRKFQGKVVISRLNLARSELLRSWTS